MLPVPIAGIMLLIGQRPSAVREYKRCSSSHRGIMLLIGQRPSAVRNIRGAASSHSRDNAFNWSEALCNEGI